MHLYHLEKKQQKITRMSENIIMTRGGMCGGIPPLYTIASHVPVPMLQERTPTVLLLCEYLSLSFLFLLSELEEPPTVSRSKQEEQEKEEEITVTKIPLLHRKYRPKCVRFICYYIYFDTFTLNSMVGL